MKYDIEPCTYARITQRNKWTPARKKYLAFKDECRYKKVQLPTAGAQITFRIAMPKSWPKYKKEKMVGRPHQQKPDLDNLLKALVDACYQEDKGIWNYGELKKLWDYKGSIIIE